MFGLLGDYLYGFFGMENNFEKSDRKEPKSNFIISISTIDRGIKWDGNIEEYLKVRFKLSQ